MTKVHEIPFQALPQNRYVPWIVGLMCYITLLVLGGATYLNDLLSQFQQVFERSLTIEVTTPHQGFMSPEIKKKHKERVQKTLRVLKQHPNVERVEALNTAFFEELTPAWKQKLGRDPFSKKPFLIEVYPKKGKTVRSEDIERYSQRFLQGVKAYDIHPLKQSLLQQAWSGLIAALVLALLISLCAISIIIFTTYTGLSLQQRTVEILRLVGATNSFIARRFQEYATSLALKGALIGVTLASLTFFPFVGISLFKEYGSLQGILLLAPTLLILLTFLGAKASYVMLYGNVK